MDCKATRQPSEKCELIMPLFTVPTELGKEQWAREIWKNIFFISLAFLISLSLCTSLLYCIVLPFHGKVLAAEVSRSGLCEQTPALPQIRACSSCSSRDLLLPEPSCEWHRVCSGRVWIRKGKSAVQRQVGERSKKCESSLQTPKWSIFWRCSQFTAFLLPCCCSHRPLLPFQDADEQFHVWKWSDLHCVDSRILPLCQPNWLGTQDVWWVSQ